MEVVQVFTKNQQQWHSMPLAAHAVKEWQFHCRRLKFRRTVSHASYLINLASPDAVLRDKSIAMFVEELARCAALNIPYLVTHPGAHMGAGEKAGLSRIAGAIDDAYRRLGSVNVTTCLEITAGQGTSLGCKLEHLAELISMSHFPRRLGVCLDTAHLFAAGYDFRGRRYARFRREVDSTVGLSRIKVLHLNDSKTAFGSHVDRHEHIGQGTIGVEGFRHIVRDEQFVDVPKILETPKDKTEDGRDWDAVNLQTLHALME